MSVADPSPEPPELPFEAPHSRLAILLRLLAAFAIAGIAFGAHLLWLDDSPAQDRHGAKVHKINFPSELMKREMPVRVVVPKGAQDRKNRSMVVFLHGRGESSRTYLTDEMFEALSEQRRRAPVMAFPSGGGSSYWHDRESGPWASYILEELIPKLTKRFRVDPGRIAIGGISMGGYGAFNIARSAPGRFCAVGGHSPAIWVSAGDAADGAFDDAADFERNDLISIARSMPNPFAGPQLWLDAGDRDPFLEADQEFEAALRGDGLRPIASYPEGRHERAYWNERWPDYLGFYVRSLGSCEVDLTPVSGSGPKRQAVSDSSSPRKPGGGRDDQGAGRERP